MLEVQFIAKKRNLSVKPKNVPYSVSTPDKTPKSSFIFILSPQFFARNLLVFVAKFSVPDIGNLQSYIG